MLIAAFIFSGCALFQKDNQEEEKPVANENQVINADTVLDNQMFEAAVRGKDLASCDGIKDSAKKEECKTTVTDLTLTEKAFNKLDKSICNGIKNERYKENCKATIENEIAKKDKLAKADEKRLSIEQDAINKGNADICNDIEDENQKYSCRYNVIVNQAESKKDPSLCDKIGKESFIKQCKEENF